MAGGDKTNEHGTMADRVARMQIGHSAPMNPRPSGPTLLERRERADYRPRDPQHVWILTEAGRVPGLFIEWRKPVGLPWEGHVKLMRLDAGRWALVDQWLPAGAIESAT